MAEGVSTTNITNSENVFNIGDVSAGRDANINITNPPQDADSLAQKIHSALAKKIQRRTASRIEAWTPGMVRTKAMTQIVDMLTRGTTWVTVKGQPGEGKTTAAYMALEELNIKSGRQVFEVISPNEFSEVISTCANPLIVLDDIFGELEFSQSKWSTWEPVLHQVLSLKEHRSHEKRAETSKKTNVTVVLVGRDYVLNSASTDMGRFSDYFTRDEHVVFMSKPGERDIQEKRDIWKTISVASGIELDEKTIDTICKISVPHGFPHVCRLFVTMRKEDPNIKAERFFNAPLEFLNKTVQKFMHDKVKLSLFKEIIKRNGSVNIRDLGNVDNSFDIIETAKSLVGSYLNNEDGNFTFNHPSIYDSVAFNICKTYPLFVIENCHLSFLHERLRLDTQHPTSNRESNLVVYIPRSCIVDLAKRFAVDIENRNLMLVLSHKALTDQLIIEELMSHITLPLTELLTLTDKQTYRDGYLEERYDFLSLVASNKSPQLLKYIDNQTDIQLTEKDINTVLYGVCKYAASDVLTYLVQSRDTLDINVRYKLNKTPLMIASETRDSQFVQQIMSLGPDLKAKDSESHTVLHYLCQHGLGTQVEQLIDTVGVVDVKHWGERSPLWLACWYNHVDVARLLIDRGARFNAVTLLDACSRGNLDVVTLLFERGATVNMRTYWCTPLTEASKGGHVKVMRFLIANGASVNTVDGSGWSPIYMACFQNKPQAVQCLLDHGADINSRDCAGYRLLGIAARKRYRECVQESQESGDVRPKKQKKVSGIHVLPKMMR